MGVAWNWWAVPGTLAMVLAWLVAVFIYAAAPSRSANRRLAVFLAVEGIFIGTASGAVFFVERAEDAFALQVIGTAALAAATFIYPLFLGAVLDTPLTRPFAGGRALVAFSGLALAAALVVVLLPRLFITAPYAPSFAPWNAQFTELGQRIPAADGLMGWFGLAAALWAWRATPRGSIGRRRAGIFVLAFGARDLYAGVFQLTYGIVRPIPFWGDFVFNPGQGFAYVVYVSLLGYGVLRFQLLDIDLRIKRTISRGTVVAAFAAVFFVVGVVAENFLSDRYGYLVGGAAAGFLLLVLQPLQALGRHVADAAMPRVHDTPAYLAYRKMEVYRAALEGALQDGEVTPKEREVLRRLRESLGVAEADAAALEHDLAAPG